MKTQSGTNQNMAFRVVDYFRRSQIAGTMIVLGAILVVSSFVSNKFLTPYNLQIMVRSLAFTGMVSLGQGLLLLLGDIDLSVGAVAGLCGVICGKFAVEMHLNPYLAIVLALMFGLLFGAFNGLLVTSFKLNAIVLTIGMQTVYRGINQVITKGRTITGFPKNITVLGAGNVIGIPTPAIVLVAVFCLMYFLTRRTTYGRNVYAVGNSIDTAKMVGIKTQRVRIISYAICGFLAGLAGILMSMRLASAQASIGEIWVLPSIAAPVIGGVATTGGIGSITGALIGGAIMGVVSNIIVLGNVNIYWQQVLNGAIVVVAIIFDSFAQKFRKI
ncbi:MAG: ABC transporter permease [Spirochaetales bacterium]|jgi:ribose transport system permease protein|nr:ABC transporter permease [Spirochaetales bacterium]